MTPAPHRSTPRRAAGRTTLAAATLVMAAAQAGAGPAASAAGSCSARSGATPPLVVELYTSEGCSSCPPADRWLSSLKGRGDVLALAFHVTYWDYLGWADRFAIPEGTQRQRDLARRDGLRAVYTPQVRADGRDWTEWPRLPRVEAAAAVPALHLSRDGSRVIAQVDAAVPPPAAAPRGRGDAGSSAGSGTWSGYWAVLEHDHSSRVRAGENAGETLRHDHVVRLWKAVPAWPRTQVLSASLEVLPGSSDHPRRVAFVVVDPRSERPVQALALDC